MEAAPTEILQPTELSQLVLAPGKILIDLDPPTKVSKTGIVSNTSFFLLDEGILRGTVVAVGKNADASEEKLYAVGDRVAIFGYGDAQMKIQLDGVRFFILDQYSILAKTAPLDADTMVEIEESKKAFYDKKIREATK